MSEKKPYVRIQSNITIKVTGGLQCEDVTNKDAHVPDRLKVNPLWPKMSCLIKAGAGVYPSYVADWNTVKCLANDKVLTIGEYLDTADEETTKAKEELDRNIQRINEKIKKEKKERKEIKNLSELAGEDNE